MELLKSLYIINSYSGNEETIRTFVQDWVVNHSGINPEELTVVNDDMNLYITRGKADTYPCVVAHLDQVQRMYEADTKIVETEDIIFSYSPKTHEQQGLGADDKNGIWIALKALQKFDTIKVAFFAGEEVGCVGSSQADMAFFNDVRFVIQPDRKGGTDIIKTIGGTELMTEEFMKLTDYDAYGFSPTSGLMTDVETLCDKGLQVCCFNISCGYYSPHTEEEFTVKEDLENTRKFIFHVIEKCTDVYPCAHEKSYTRTYYNGLTKISVGGSNAQAQSSRTFGADCLDDEYDNYYDDDDYPCCGAYWYGDDWMSWMSDYFDYEIHPSFSKVKKTITTYFKSVNMVDVVNEYKRLIALYDYRLSALDSYDINRTLPQPEPKTETPKKKNKKFKRSGRRGLRK